jgi:hypothetical protein
MANAVLDNSDVPLFADVADDTVMIDTSNYYPKRDGVIAAIKAGQTESACVAEQLGRPIAKAWNAITSTSVAEKGAPAGAAGRIAIPVCRRWRALARSGDAAGR